MITRIQNMQPRSGNPARCSAHRPRSEVEPICLPATARGFPGVCNNLSAKFHPRLKHSKNDLLGGRDVMTWSLTITHRPEDLVSLGEPASEEGPPWKRDGLACRRCCSSSGFRLVSFPSTPENTRGQRHPSFKQPTCTAAAEPLHPCKEQLQDAVGCRGQVPAPAEPPPSLHCIWPLINQHLPEIRWEVSVNQLQTIKSLAKLLSCYFCKELGLYKIKQHES